MLHEEYKYKSRSRVEKYRHLTDPKTFLLEDGVRAANFLRNTDCQRCKDAFRFGRPETKNSGFLFEKHSPLRAVFKDGLVHIVDNRNRFLAETPKPIKSCLKKTNFGRNRIFCRNEFVWPK